MIDWSLLIGCVIGAAAGLPVGYFLGFRRVRKEGGASVLVPMIDHRPLKQRIREANFRQALHWGAEHWLVALMTCMVLIGLVQITTVSYRYRTCNDVLWDTIIERSEIAGDTEQARQENDRATYDWAKSWLALSEDPAAAGNRDQAIVSLRQFVDTYDDNVARQEANAKLRANKPFQRC
ncbi:hypothetical protein [Nocardia sp. NPDC049149]|uniref:hypothetical protein n=1 Tax=Nocardia sp. NPDC049149 TaxID=3364315 RepID=UPI003721FBE0